MSLSDLNVALLVDADNRIRLDARTAKILTVQFAIVDNRFECRSTHLNEFHSLFRMPSSVRLKNAVMDVF
jgi:hypothetical protein